MSNLFQFRCAEPAEPPVQQALDPRDPAFDEQGARPRGHHAAQARQPGPREGVREERGRHRRQRDAAQAAVGARAPALAEQQRDGQLERDAQQQGLELGHG
ncbi:MAG: hypothetical protein ACK559_29440, partial [bacterium]